MNYLIEGLKKIAERIPTMPQPYSQFVKRHAIPLSQNNKKEDGLLNVQQKEDVVENVARKLLRMRAE